MLPMRHQGQNLSSSSAQAGVSRLTAFTRPFSIDNAQGPSRLRGAGVGDFPVELVPNQASWQLMPPCGVCTSPSCLGLIQHLMPVGVRGSDLVVLLVERP